MEGRELWAVAHLLLPILRDNLSTMGFIVFVRLIDVSGQVPLGSPAGLQLGFSNEAFRFKEHRPGSQWGLVECRPICLGHLFFRLLFVIGLSTQAYLKPGETDDCFVWPVPIFLPVFKSSAWNALSCHGPAQAVTSRHVAVSLYVDSFCRM